MMIRELTTFEDGCLRKAIAEEPKPSLKELPHLAQIKRFVAKIASWGKKRKK